MTSAQRGALYGLSAAALFGLSAPIAKRLLAEVSPVMLAGLLYLGAGLALSLWIQLRPHTAEAPVVRRDVPLLLAVVVSGGLVGPLLMLLGLQRVSAVAGSMLLNLEGPFTIVLAVVVFREHLGTYGVVATGLILLGAAVLKLGSGEVVLDTLGLLALAGASAAWALDNNLTQRLSLRDPRAVVRIKTLGAGALNVAIALALGHALPGVTTLVLTLVVGALSYGLSIVLDAYALREVGAAREAAYFATAPFVGALASTVIVGEALGPADLGAMLLMGGGVVALLRERHAHEHAHEALDHTHVHTHDAHHQHDHGPDVPSGEPHAHAHHHAPLVHDHPHTPDLHHRHRH